MACLSMDTRTVYGPLFPELAIQAIREDVETIDGPSSTSVVNSVHRFLIHRQLSKHSKPKDGYILWREAQEQGLTNHEIDFHVEAFLQEATKRTDLDLDLLRAHVGLKNFLDEVPDIQLII